MLINVNSTALDKKTMQTLEELKKLNNFLEIYSALQINNENAGNYKDLVSSYRDLFNFIYMNIEDFYTLREEEQVDLLLDISEVGTQVLFSGSQEINTQPFVSMIANLGVELAIICKNYLERPGVRDFDSNDLNILSEIFEMKPVGYDIRDFTVTLDIDGRGAIALKEMGNLRATFNLNHLDYREDILSKALELDALNKYFLDNHKLYPFSFKTYEPPFNLNLQTVLDILEYKWKVFESIRDMRVEDMGVLPKEVIDFCNHNEFIPYKEALQIINGEYPFIKYYTNGGE